MKISKITLIIFICLLAIHLFQLAWFVFKNKHKFNLNFVHKEKKFAFFDLGANEGDTVMLFFDNKLIDLNNYTNEKWEVHAFEPNPKFINNLTRVKEKYSSNAIINLYLKTAAWIKNGEMNLYIDDFNRNSEATSIFEHHPDVNKTNVITVETLDVAKLIDKYDINDFVIIKIDVEGAEYDILLHLIVTNVIKKIDVAIIEFHQYINKLNTTENLLESILNLYGITFYNWY